MSTSGNRPNSRRLRPALVDLDEVPIPAACAVSPVVNLLDVSAQPEDHRRSHGPRGNSHSRLKLVDYLYCACIVQAVDTIQEVSRIIRDAELAIHQLLERAVGEQRYADVTAIAPIAEALSRIARGQSGNEPPKPEKHTIDGGNVKASVRRSVSKGYPKFSRDGSRLVKVGWSKKTTEEYEHRAPLELGDALIAAIRAKVRDGQKFAATDVIPLQLKGEAAPDYQAYLLLKWLHTEGVIIKHGRDQYAIEPGRIGPDGLKAIWSRLPT